MNIRTLWATLAGMGSVFCFFVVSMVLYGEFFKLDRAGDLYFPPVFYKPLYLFVVLLATYALVRYHSPAIRAGLLFASLMFSLTFEYRRYEHPLHSWLGVWLVDYLFIGGAVIGLSVGWKLLLYVLGYYRNILRRDPLRP